MAQNGIDPDISHLILDFFLHQPIPNRILYSILEVLPIPSKDPLISKLLLLRKLQSNISNISEEVLDFLDIIRELDISLGIQECPDSLKKAYCAVAVECSVRCLRESRNDVKGEFFDMVKSVWRGRVRELEEGNVGLVSDELLEWRDDIDAAILEEDVCLKVIERSKDIDAVETVRVYVEEEKSRMMPSVIDAVIKCSKEAEFEKEHEALGSQGGDVLLL